MNALPTHISELLDTAPPSPGIVPDDDLAAAALKTWRYHFAEVLRHEPGTRLGEDIEALHDMRVATRRLRASFDVFGSAFNQKALLPHLKGLKATGRALGGARDMDVFIEKADIYRQSLPIRQRSKLTLLFDAWEGERASARQAMTTYLDSEAYTQFVENFAVFLQAPEGYARQKGEAPSLRLIIPGLIYARLQPVLAYETIMATIPLVKLHALRIEFKKLRYTVEFFREVLGKPAKAVIETIKALQDHLGDLQDADVATSMLRAWLDRWDEEQARRPLPKRQRPDGILAYLGFQYTKRQQLMVGFPRVWAEFTHPDFQHSLVEIIAALQHEERAR
ncbi:MAG: CHAD domain-containing protein [Chloroflexota bacterium]